MISGALRHDGFTACAPRAAPIALSTSERPNRTASPQAVITEATANGSTDSVEDGHSNSGAPHLSVAGWMPIAAMARSYQSAQRSHASGTQMRSASWTKASTVAFPGARWPWVSTGSSVATTMRVLRRMHRRKRRLTTGTDAAERERSIWRCHALVKTLNLYRTRPCSKSSDTRVVLRPTNDTREPTRSLNSFKMGSPVS